MPQKARWNDNIDYAFPVSYWNESLRKAFLCQRISIPFTSDTYPWIRYRELGQVRYQTREIVIYDILKHHEQTGGELKNDTSVFVKFYELQFEDVSPSSASSWNFYCFKLDGVLKVDRYTLLIDFWETTNYTVFQWWWGILYVKFLFDNNSHHCGTISGSSLSHEVCYFSNWIPC